MLIVPRSRFLELRSWCRPDRANAAIAETSDASRNVVDSVISATQWRRLRCSGTYRVLGPAYNQRHTSYQAVFADGFSISAIFDL